MGQDTEYRGGRELGVGDLQDARRHQGTTPEFRHCVGSGEGDYAENVCWRQQRERTGDHVQDGGPDLSKGSRGESC